MNSIAALQRAFSKDGKRSRRSSTSNSILSTHPDTPTEDVRRELVEFHGQFHVPFTSEPKGLTSDDEGEDLRGRPRTDSQGNVPYPSPPPTPEPLPSNDAPSKESVTPKPASGKLTRTPSVRKSTSTSCSSSSLTPNDNRLDSVTRSLPVRISVAVYMLIRRLLGLFGISISRPALAIVANDPHPSIHVEPPPSYEDATKSSIRPPPIQEKSRWKLYTLGKKTKRTTPTSSVHPSVATKAQPTALSVLTKPKTLILDLDETLIHSTSRLGGLPGAGGGWGSSSLKVRVVEVVLEGKSVVYHVYKRPWVDLFLKKVAAWYTVVIFTASMREYADPVIDWLDNECGIINGRYFRESCQLVNGSYVKDLSKVKGDLTRVCLIDNSPASYSYHPANGIPIEGFISDQNDTALLELLPLLDSLRFTTDVRRILGLRSFGLAYR